VLHWDVKRTIPLLVVAALAIIAAVAGVADFGDFGTGIYW
jgi:hypothetical protein